MKGLVSNRTWTVIVVALLLVSGGVYWKLTREAAGRPSALARRIAEVPLAMWSAEALDPTGQSRGGTKVCADPMVVDGFSRPMPNFNGEPCLITKPPNTGEGRFDARCTAAGQEFAVNISRTGDPAADFTVRMRVQPLGLSDPGAVQVIRYRKLGPCPTGWRTGQSISLASGEPYDALDTRE